MVGSGCRPRTALVAGGVGRPRPSRGRCFSTCSKCRRPGSPDGDRALYSLRSLGPGLAVRAGLFFHDPRSRTGWRPVRPSYADLLSSLSPPLRPSPATGARALPLVGRSYPWRGRAESSPLLLPTSRRAGRPASIGRAFLAATPGADLAATGVVVVLVAGLAPAPRSRNGPGSILLPPARAGPSSRRGGRVRAPPCRPFREWPVEVRATAYRSWCLLRASPRAAPSGLMTYLSGARALPPGMLFRFGEPRGRFLYAHTPIALDRLVGLTVPSCRRPDCALRGSTTPKLPPSRPYF